MYCLEPKIQKPSQQIGLDARFVDFYFSEARRLTSANTVVELFRCALDWFEEELDAQNPDILSLQLEEPAIGSYHRNSYPIFVGLSTYSNFQRVTEKIPLHCTQNNLATYIILAYCHTY